MRSLLVVFDFAWFSLVQGEEACLDWVFGMVWNNFKWWLWGVEGFLWEVGSVQRANY